MFYFMTLLPQGIILSTTTTLKQLLPALGLGLCLSLPADTLVLVSAARLHRAASAQPQAGAGGFGERWRQTGSLCGLRGVDRLIRSQHRPQSVARGEGGRVDKGRWLINIVFLGGQ